MYNNNITHTSSRFWSLFFSHSPLYRRRHRSFVIRSPSFSHSDCS